MATGHRCLLWRERGEVPISTANLGSRREPTVARSTPNQRERGSAGSPRPLDGPWYRTERPAEGHPAIVTGCAGVSCPVTLTAVTSRIVVAPPEQLRPCRPDRDSTLVQSHSLTARSSGAAERRLGDPSADNGVLASERPTSLRDQRSPAHGGRRAAPPRQRRPAACPGHVRMPGCAGLTAGQSRC